MQQVTRIDKLESHFKAPQDLVLNKVVSGLDAHTEQFLRQSPFAIYATQNVHQQIDLSPRGGKPGFILIEDEHTLLLPEYAGNDRLDTLKNLILNPHLGIISMVPGIGETLRFKGTAKVFLPSEKASDNLKSTDYFSKFTPPLSTPKAIIEFKIETLYFQCAAALKLSKLWTEQNKIDRTSMPSIYQIIEDQIKKEQFRQTNQEKNT